MRLSRILPAIILTLTAIPMVPLEAAPPGGPARADFSGSWILNEGQSTRIADLLAKDGFVPTAPDPAAAQRRGSKGGGVAAGGGLSDSASQLLEEARALVILDEGDVVRINRGGGKKRTIYPDGEEREIDDGEGPADVKAKRKGGRGERIVVASKWSGGRSIDETWEVVENPRRLLVTTKVSGRRSFTVKRVYEPEAETAAVVPASAPVAVVPVPTVVAPAAPTPAPAAATPPAGMAKCSLRSPRGASPSEIAGLAKVSQAAAERRALEFVAPRKPVSVISSEPEVYDGCVVWTYVLRFSDPKGVQEIAIDAGDGKVLTSVLETEGAAKP
jgi:hypothetical protein